MTKQAEGLEVITYTIQQKEGIYGICIFPFNKSKKLVLVHTEEHECIGVFTIQAEDNNYNITPAVQLDDVDLTYIANNSIRKFEDQAINLTGIAQQLCTELRRAKK